MHNSEITCCENCPFNVPGGEYDGYCNHPLAPNENSFDNNQKSICYDLGVSKENMPKTNKTSWGTYHYDTNAIPTWCPLRDLKTIDIGVKVSINLDNQLYEENFI
jgi:hypothetical protein